MSDRTSDEHPPISDAEWRIRAVLGGINPPIEEPDERDRSPRRPLFTGTMADRESVTTRWGPRALVGLAVLFGLYVLRTERLPVAYPNDSSVHSLTVTFSAHQILSGHLPLDGWFPFLSLGSPYFLHYQSFSAVMTGLLGTVIGGPQAFAWTGYLLLSLWPIALYIGCRLFDLDRWTAACAAAVAPIVTNGGTGYGFEHEAFIFYGSGLWSMLWAMLLLPIALGLAWRAVSRRQQVVLAGFALGGMIVLHFLTAYLAGLSMIVFVLLRPTEIVQRLKRALVVGAMAVLTSCWVLVPLISMRKWAAANEFEVHTYFDDSYGAKQVLSWLFHGQIFDAGHFPVITILAGIGFVACAVRWRSDERARALIGVFLLSLFLYFGRVTFGSAINILPGSPDLLFHRYVMGVQLLGMIFAGVGLTTLARAGRSTWKLVRDRPPIVLPVRLARIAPTIVAICLVVAILEPAWRSIAAYDGYSGTSIQAQRVADATTGAQVDALIARAEQEGGGRIYAGLPSESWAFNFRVGAVPVYIYLADQGVDAVGFSLRTLSLMTGPEAYFNEYTPANYPLFGIHYLIYPQYRPPPVPATLVESQGEYDLYALNNSFGYVHVVDTSGTIVADKANLGRQNAVYFFNGLAGKGIFDTVAFDGAPAAPPTANPAALPTTAAGTMLGETDNFDQGEASATVRLARTAVVVLSASFDPGWRVTVDGQSATPEMIAPAIVGVTVGPGIHTVAFRYQSYPWYPELFAVADIAVGVGFAYERRRRTSAAASPGDSGDVAEEGAHDVADQTT